MAWNRKRLYYEVILPFAKILEEMQWQGMRVDVKRLQQLKSEFETERDYYEKEIIHLTRKEFNINSSQQLAKVLYEDLKIPNYITDYKFNYQKNEWVEYKDEFLTDGQRDARISGKKVKGTSTNIACLSKLQFFTKHPIIKNIVEYRRIKKLLSTYIDGLIPFVSDKGRVHPTWTQDTKGGRISASNPPVATIPSRTERGRKIKSIYIADEGHSLFEADYSQVELRFLAWLSGDKVFLDAYKNNVDIHALTTAGIKGFNLSYEEALKNPLRAAGKTTNFLMTYLGGAYILQTEFIKQGIFYSLKDCTEFIFAFFQQYPDVKYFYSKIEEAMFRDGYVENIFHRRRYFDFSLLKETIDKATTNKEKKDAQSNFNQAKRESKKQAVSQVVQGSSTGDYSALKSIGLSKILEQNGSRLWNVLYDGYFIQVPDNKVDKVKSLTKEYLETKEDPVCCDHPIDLSKTGKAWSELK